MAGPQTRFLGLHVLRERVGGETMERSYGVPTNFASKQMIFIAHIGEIYYKGLDIPSSIPLITQGFSSHP